MYRLIGLHTCLAFILFVAVKSVREVEYRENYQYGVSRGLTNEVGLEFGEHPEEIPLSGCMNLINFENVLDYFARVTRGEQLNTVCLYMRTFLKCIRRVVREETGHDVRTLAQMWKGTPSGQAISSLVSATDLVEELCTEGTRLRTNFLRDINCLRNIDMDVLTKCEEKATDVSVIFRPVIGLQAPSDSEQAINERCVITVVQLACLGVAVAEKCGDYAFKTYEEILRKTGYIQSGICPSYLIQQLRYAFLHLPEMMETSEARGLLYHMMLYLERRK